MFTLEQAEKIVKRNHFLQWDGWTIQVIDPTKDGFFKKNGIRFINKFGGPWSTYSTIEMNKEGLYAIPAKYSRVIRTA